MTKPTNQPNHKEEKESILKILTKIRETLVDLLPDADKKYIAENGLQKYAEQFRQLPYYHEYADILFKNTGVVCDVNGIAQISFDNPVGPGISYTHPVGWFQFNVKNIIDLEINFKNNYFKNFSSVPSLPGPKQHSFANEFNPDGSYRKKEDILQDIYDRIRLNQDNIKEAKRVGKNKLIELFQTEISNLEKLIPEVQDKDYEELEQQRIIYSYADKKGTLLNRLRDTAANFMTTAKRVLKYNLLDYDVQWAIPVFEYALETADLLNNTGISLQDHSNHLKQSIEVAEKEINEKFWSARLKGLRKPKTKTEESTLSRLQNSVQTAKNHLNYIEAYKGLIHSLLITKQPEPEVTPVENSQPTMNYQSILPKLIDFTGEAANCPWMPGVLLMHGNATATDKYILASFKCDYPESLEGKILDKDFNEIEAEYPNYKAIIPEVNTYNFRILEPFEYNNIRQAIENIKRTGEYSILKLGSCYFGIDKLAPVLELMDSLEQQATFYLRKGALPSMIQSSECTCLVMPIKGIDGTAGIIYTLEQALNLPGQSSEEEQEEVVTTSSALEDFAEDITQEPTNKEICTMCHCSSGCDNCCKECKKDCNAKQICQIGIDDQADRLEAWKAIEAEKPKPEVKQPAKRQTNKKPATLAIDIETFSPEDLKKAGVYRYASHPDFEIMLFAYAFDDEPIELIDFTDLEELPERVLQALTDPGITKTAFNANFERTCIREYLKIDVSVEQWECTMVQAARLGYPLHLEAVAKVMKLPEQKMAEGKALIRYFSCPCKPTKSNENRTRNRSFHAPEKWESFKTYCKKDVEVERAIRKNIAWFDEGEEEKKLYCLDQEINDRGVLVDPAIIDNAIRFDATYKEVLTSEATELTSLDNVNSVSQLKNWISEETGIEVESLTKESIATMLKAMPSDEVKRLLNIRQEMAKTSVKKYQAMKEASGSDGRIRGLLQFYGANRTGRWAGRLVQVQNLPQNHLKDLDLARQILKEGDLEMFEMLFGNVPDTLSQLIRTAFIPSPEKTFIVADFSAIEARVIAWLAAEKWRMDVFATHGKIYEASASQMFKVPIEQVTKGSDYRQRGKVSELALGYQGGTSALTSMGALKMGILEEELQGLVDTWRAANPAIVQLWKDVNAAAIKAVKEGTVETAGQGTKIKFYTSKDSLFIELPSGRKLSYLFPQLRENRFGSQSICYQGMNQTSKQWERIETYGGKLVENIVQAIARDCLAYAMTYVDAAGYKIVMHIHDEAVIEVPEDYSELNLETVCNIMSKPIPWAKGLPLRADGYVTPYYRKD